MNETLLNVVQLQVRYHDWAIREMWRGLSALPEGELALPRGTSFNTLQATLTHMYMADRVWTNRLSGSAATQMSSIAAPAQALLEEVWISTLDELCGWTAVLDNESLSRSIEYANSTGALFRTPVWQVLFHVVNHGSGHRGQVNGMIRQAGDQPLNTDLIQFYRSRN